MAFDFNDPANIQLASALEADRGLPKGSLFAVAQQESRGNANALSPAGAKGLMQFMPATAKQYNVDPHNPLDSLRGAADFLGDLTKQYGGNFNAALAHYNGGSRNGALVAQGGTPNNQETSNYVTQVNGRMQPTGDHPQAPASNTITPQISNQVAQLRLHGADDDAIFELLRSDPSQSAMVQDAFKQGVTKEAIVKTAGGAPLAQAQATIDKIGQQGALTRFAQGGWEGLKDVGHGIGQLVDRATGDDAALKADQATQQARENDPERAALLGSTAGAIGHGVGTAAPALAAAPFTDGGSLLGLLGSGALGGAAVGATTPTTGDGQIVPNVLGGAAGGAAGGAVGYGAGKILGTALGGGDGALVTRLNAAKQLAPGEVALSDVPGAAQTTSLAAHNVPFAGGQSLDSIAGKQNYIITKGLLRQFDPAVLEGVDTSAGKITPDLVSQMKSNIQGMYSHLDGVTVKLDPGTLAPLQATLQKAEGTGVMTGLQDLSKPAQAITNLQKAAESGEAVPLTELQKVASALKNDVQYNPSADHGARMVAKDVTEGLTKIINDSLAAQDPALGTIYTDANRAFAMHKLIEDLSSRTAQGERNISPAMLNTSMNNVFGKTPVQNGLTQFSGVQKHVNDAFGDSSSKLGKLIGSTLNNTVGHDAGLIGLVHSPHIAIPAMALGRVITGITDSTSPALQKLFTGATALGRAANDPTMRAALAKIVSAGGTQIDK